MDLIVKMKFGSHLYGTASEHSDTDYKGVYLPSREAVLLGDIQKCLNHSTGCGTSKNKACDVDYWNRFICETLEEKRFGNER